MSNDNPQQPTAGEAMQSVVVIYGAVLAALVETATPEQKAAITQSLDAAKDSNAKLFESNPLAVGMIDELKRTAS